MKRRKFLQTAGVASAVLSLGSLMAFDRFRIVGNRQFLAADLKLALENYFDEILSGKDFNPKVMLPNGKLIVIKSYSIEINDQKNNVFDIADLVIDRLKQSGFNAQSLKKGEIPDGLKIGPGVIYLPGGGFPIPIEELRNYDATLILDDSYSIYSECLPSDWKDITFTEKQTTPKGMDIIKGKIGLNEFRIFHSEKSKAKPLQFRFNVSQRNPKMVFDDYVPEILLAYTKFSKLISEDVLKNI